LEKVTTKLRNISAGGHLTNEKLRDWVVSRQRYWGTPCPIIYCEKCNVVPVPYEDLPVELPIVDKLSTKGLSQLKDTDWFKTKCPKYVIYLF
jgi:leucyl-tRNA synthetase